MSLRCVPVGHRQSGATGCARSVPRIRGWKSRSQCQCSLYTRYEVAGRTLAERYGLFSQWHQTYSAQSDCHSGLPERTCVENANVDGMARKQSSILRPAYIDGPDHGRSLLVSARMASMAGSTSPFSSKRVRLSIGLPKVLLASQVGSQQKNPRPRRSGVAFRMAMNLR
jgi:hypothetical protein